MKNKKHYRTPVGLLSKLFKVIIKKIKPTTEQTVDQKDNNKMLIKRMLNSTQHNLENCLTANIGAKLVTIQKDSIVTIEYEDTYKIEYKIILTVPIGDAKFL